MSVSTPYLRASRSSFQARVVQRVLIVHAYIDDRRLYTPYPDKVPQAMGPIYLAGAFCSKQCEVRVFNEHHSGPLPSADLLGWPDMLVLTGLTSGFDRMLHLTAYARTLNRTLSPTFNRQRRRRIQRPDLHLLDVIERFLSELRREID